MIIDTREEASTLWRTKLFVIAIYVVLVFVTAIFIPIGTTAKILIYGGSSVMFIVLYWFQYQMEYTYFYFSNNNKNLVFKFYSLRNLYGNPKTIEISKVSFLKYDIVSGFFNKRDSLVLYQKTPRGIAKYPPISLTLLNKKQKTELKRVLYAATNH